MYLLLIYSDDAEALLGSTNTLNTTGGTENYYYQEYTTLRNQWTPWCSLLVYIDRLVKIKPNLYEINKITVLDFKNEVFEVFEEFHGIYLSDHPILKK